MRFEDLVLPPPFTALVALLVVAGVYWLGGRYVRWTAGSGQVSMLDAATGFVVVAALIASSVHALAWTGFATVPVLRVIGASLMVCGLFAVVPIRRQGLDPMFEALRQASALERWVLLASSVTMLGLGIGSLGPPTEADTLSYHLPVALEWLQLGAHPTPDWLHARLIGVGDAVNLLGLALGTDCLGAGATTMPRHVRAPVCNVPGVGLRK